MDILQLELSLSGKVISAYSTYAGPSVCNDVIEYVG